MKFKIIGSIKDEEIIASSKYTKELKRLKKIYGEGKWRKMKGNATIELENGSKYMAEVHRYEAHGIGKKEYKIKKFIN